VDILVATEPNMMWRMQRDFPQHRYHPLPGVACSCTKCPHMARNTLEKLCACLAHESPEICWQPEFDQAAIVLERSFLKREPLRSAWSGSTGERQAEEQASIPT
jgi:quinolinate synthase